MKPVVAAFDFDGTITTKDTLLVFIRFVKGPLAFGAGLLLFSPVLIAFKLKWYPNWKAKQLLFSYFFKGMTCSDFNEWSNRFGLMYQHLIRPKAREAICQHLDQDHEVVIVSASIENWVLPFATQLGITSLLCTQIEVDANNRLTGRFASANCHGKEKIRRILGRYPNRSEYHLIAYGDSNGDKPMLEFADEGFYKAFE